MEVSLCLCLRVSLLGERLYDQPNLTKGTARHAARAGAMYLTISHGAAHVLCRKRVLKPLIEEARVKSDNSSERSSNIVQPCPVRIVLSRLH